MSSKDDSKEEITLQQGEFISVHISGSIEGGYFKENNDIYLKYSILTGPDWILSSGTDIGVTQIARCRQDKTGARLFVWNQPIGISYRTYNFYGWPQIVLSVYCFDTFGNDQIVGYGAIHLPISNKSLSKRKVNIYSPQSSSYLGQLMSWVTGRRPELINSESFARGDLRNALQVKLVGYVEIDTSLITKDVSNNGYNCG